MHVCVRAYRLEKPYIPIHRISHTVRVALADSATKRRALLLSPYPYHLLSPYMYHLLSPSRALLLSPYHLTVRRRALLERPPRPPLVTISPHGPQEPPWTPHLSSVHLFTFVAS